MPRLAELRVVAAAVAEAPVEPAVAALPVRS